jgi:hypothetical protein
MPRPDSPRVAQRKTKKTLNPFCAFFFCHTWRVTLTHVDCSTSSEEVEEELTPVLHLLVSQPCAFPIYCIHILHQQAEFTRSGGSAAEKIKRRDLMLQIGRHIQDVLRRKTEEGQDLEWWRSELWTFVLKATPKKKNPHRFTWQDYEIYYHRREAQVAQLSNLDSDVKLEVE